MLKIGLTGGIGSGKTKVADFLHGWGASLVDADAIAHAMTAPGGRAIDAIREAFGVQSLTPDGAMNREWMRNQAFESPLIKRRLEAILHPLIAEVSNEQAAVADGAYLVFVIPLLVESGRWADRVDRVCVVDCEPETQILRVQKRSGLTTETIRRIMAAQADRDTRLAAADDVIFNGAAVTEQALKEAAHVLHRMWMRYGQ